MVLLLKRRKYLKVRFFFIDWEDISARLFDNLIFYANTGFYERLRLVFFSEDLLCEPFIRSFEGDEGFGRRRL